MSATLHEVGRMHQTIVKIFNISKWKKETGETR